MLPVFDRFDFDPRFRQMQSRFRTQVGHHVDFNVRGIEPVGANSVRRQAVPEPAQLLRPLSLLVYLDCSLWVH